VYTAIDFVAKTVAERKARTSFPVVLEIKVIGFAANSGLVELRPSGSVVGESADVVGVGASP